MKKLLIALAVLIALLGVGYGAYRYWFANLNEESPEEARGAFPVITFQLGDGRTVNETHGYLDEMAIPSLRKTVVPTDGTHTLYAKIEGAGDITKAVYEVLDLSGEEQFETGELSLSEEKGKEGLVKFQFGDVWRNEREAILCITLTVRDGSVVRYYTRITREAPLNTEKCVNFACDFSKWTQTDAFSADVAAYLEPNAKGDRTTQQHVTLNSSVDQVMWGDMDVESFTEPEVTILETTESYTCLALRYRASFDRTQEIGDCLVEEYYRIRCAKKGIYLLDFDRTVEEEFRPENAICGTSGLEFGIADPSLLWCADKAGERACFVRDGALWEYERSENILTKIFPVEANEDFTDRDVSRLIPVSISEKGNVIFLAAGYRSGGEREGHVGMELFSYDSAENEVTSLLYYNFSEGERYVLKDLTEHIHYSRTLNAVYLSLGHELYRIDLESGEEHLISDKVLLPGEEAGTNVVCIFSDAGDLAVYPTSEDSIEVLNMDTGRSYRIEPEGGGRLLPIGFIGGDLAYGVARISDIGTDESGAEVLPMYQVRIITTEGELQKSYEREGMWFLRAEATDALVTLHCAAKDGEIYRASGEEYIKNNEEAEIQNIRMESWQDAICKKMMRLTFPELLPDEEPKKTQAQTAAENSPREFFIEAPERHAFAVYGKGVFQSLQSDAGMAIVIADSVAGVVTDEKGHFFWERGNRDLIHEIEGASYGPVPDGSINVSGVTAEELCCLINQNRMIYASAGEGVTWVLIGYDEGALYYLDGEGGERKGIGLADAENLFAENGRSFYAGPIK